MKQYRKWSLASLFVCLFFLCGCDSTSMKDVAVSSPEILSFSPESGSIGSEIVVTGEYLAAPCLSAGLRRPDLSRALRAAQGRLRRRSCPQLYAGGGADTGGLP